MPFSTNAPFNEKGHAEQLRDIEYLYLKLQELYKAAGIDDGDLNPGGGRGVSQGNADDGWGSADPNASGSGDAAVAVNVELSGTPGTGVFVTLNGASTEDTTGGSWSNPSYTAPVTGYYLLSTHLTLGLSGNVGAYYVWSAQITVDGGQVAQVYANANDIPNGSSYTPLSTSAIVYLLAGQIVQVQASGALISGTASASALLSQASKFSAHRIGSRSY